MMNDEIKKASFLRYWTGDKTTANGRSAHAAGKPLVQHHAPSNYHQLRRACRERGILYDDPDFPATARSLYAHKKPSLGGPITWLRPHVSPLIRHELSVSLFSLLSPIARLMDRPSQAANYPGPVKFN